MHNDKNVKVSNITYIFLFDIRNSFSILVLFQHEKIIVFLSLILDIHASRFISVIG